MAEPIGYDVNDGGINNQKLALLGLVIIAYETNAPIYLPKILSKDQRETRSSVHSFAEIFDQSLFLGFLKRWNVSTVDAPQRDYADRIERCGWRFFDAGAWHLGQGGKPTTTGIVADFFRSLRPLVTQDIVFIKLCAQIFGDNDISVVNQLRIEEDWRIHCQYNLDPVIKDPEDYNLSASDIVRKTRDTLKINRAFVSCDEKYIHIARADLAKQVKDETGVQILWKADFLDVGDAEAMRPIEASLIDFELAKISQTFVGMSRSTFANLATYERYCSRYRDYHQDYIYNFPSSRLALRVDHGRLVDPFEVCGVRRRPS